MATWLWTATLSEVSRMMIQGLDLRLLRMCARRPKFDTASFDCAAKELSKFSFQGYWSVGLRRWMWARYAYIACLAGSTLLLLAYIPAVPMSVRIAGLVSMIGVFVCPLVVILAMDRLVALSINRSRRGQCSVCDYPLSHSTSPIALSQVCAECGSSVLSPHS
jgi:hypothetical protein